MRRNNYRHLHRFVNGPPRRHHHGGFKTLAILVLASVAITLSMVGLTGEFAARHVSRDAAKGLASGALFDSVRPAPEQLVIDRQPAAEVREDSQIDLSRPKLRIPGEK